MHAVVNVQCVYVVGTEASIEAMETRQSKIENYTSITA